jgi:hypothetical protein
MERRSVSFLKRMGAGMVFQNIFFPGIDTTNTFPCPTEVWVTMRSGTYLLLKNSADNNIAENYMMKDFTDFILHLILSGRLNQEG